MHGAKHITQLDGFICERIREARLAQKMTQKEVAELIGVSYQQMQKYERGTNRLPLGRVDGLVTALNRPLAWFFPNATDVRATADPLVAKFITSKDGYQLASNWFRVPPKFRDLVLELVEQLAVDAH